MTTFGSTRRIAAAVAVLLLIVLTSPAKAVDAVYPVLGGTTTITFDGTSGVTLRVPRDVTLDRSGLDVTLDDAQFAYGVVSPQAHNCTGGAQLDVAPGADRWCLDHDFLVLPDWVLSPVKSAWTTQLKAGLVEVSVVTTGRVTLTLTVPELANSVALAATGTVHGAAARLPDTCPAQAVAGCARQGWGGVTFDDIQRPAMITAVAYAQRPNTTLGGDASAGTISSVGCVYPNQYYPETSAAAADHPTGCDFADAANTTDAQNTRNYYASWAVNPLWISQGNIHMRPASGERHYTGFAAHSVETMEAVHGGGRIGGWGYWMSKGIICPTGNHFSCQ